MDCAVTPSTDALWELVREAHLSVRLKDNAYLIERAEEAKAEVARLRGALELIASGEYVDTAENIAALTLERIDTKGTL